MFLPKLLKFLNPTTVEVSTSDWWGSQNPSDVMQSCGSWIVYCNFIIGGDIIEEVEFNTMLSYLLGSTTALCLSARWLSDIGVRTLHVCWFLFWSVISFTPLLLLSLVFWYLSGGKKESRVLVFKCVHMLFVVWQ